VIEQDFDTLIVCQYLALGTDATGLTPVILTGA
jgi:hypothetical protein